MAVAIDAPVTYVAGRKIKVGLLDLETGEPKLGDDGKQRCENRLPGDPVPEAHFWSEQVRLVNRMCGDLLTPEEVKNGIVRPSPGVVQSERVADREGRLARPLPPRPASEEPLLSAVHVEAECSPRPKAKASRRPKARARPRG